MSEIELGDVYRDGGGFRWKVVAVAGVEHCGPVTVALREADDVGRHGTAYIAFDVLQRFYTREARA